MNLIARTYWGGPPFDFRIPPGNARVEPVTLTAADRRKLRGLWWTPERNPTPRVAVVCMHPRVDFTHHYTFPRLLAAGIGCLGACSRSPNDDTTTLHEELVLDVAAAVAFLRQRGVDKVLLVGNSGGGSLAALFQAQARLPPAERITTTPGGTPTRLAGADLSPADALILIAAHRGQGKVLGECIDAAVVDESDPLRSDPDLDLYDARNGFRPPPEWSEYAPEFVGRYRAAQRARVERLDARAHELIQVSRSAAAQAAEPGFASLDVAAQQSILRRRSFEPVMVVYRTMANPSYVDHRLDPSPREYGSLLSDRPDLMNLRHLGFARTVTPEAWLSTWSALSSNADLVKNLAGIAEPLLIVHAEKDREIHPRADVAPVVAAARSPDRRFVEVEGARHYFEPEPGEKHAPDVERLMDVVVPWIGERFGV